jgi:hypothetical protein
MNEARPRPFIVQCLQNIETELGSSERQGRTAGLQLYQHVAILPDNSVVGGRGEHVHFVPCNPEAMLRCNLN